MWVYCNSTLEVSTLTSLTFQNVTLLKDDDITVLFEIICMNILNKLSRINFPECDIIEGWWHHCNIWKNMVEVSKWTFQNVTSLKHDDITVLHERIWVNIRNGILTTKFKIVFKILHPTVKMFFKGRNLEISSVTLQFYEILFFF